MERPARWGIASLAALLLLACGDPDAAPLPGPEPAEEASEAPAPAPERGPETWPARRPFVSLLLAGNQRGVIRPSPSTDPALGGLRRLAALSEALSFRVSAREGFAGVALGWSMSEHPEPQAESLAALLRATQETLGFRAAVLGTPDLLEPALVQAHEGVGPIGVPRPPANVPLSRTGMLAMAAWTEPFATFEIRGLTVRVLSVVDPDAGGLLAQSGAAEVVLPPAGALQTLSPRPEDLWIVATDARRRALVGLRDAMARLGPSVVVDLGGTAGRDRVEDLHLGAQPLVVALGDRGREVGVLDLDPVPTAEGGGWRVSYHVVELVPEYDAKPSERRDRVDALLTRYRGEVRERGYLASFGNFPDRADLAYVGSSRCAHCHPGIYEAWSTGPHARALKTLEATGRHWDPACVRCHVVGFERFQDGSWKRFASGFQTPVATPHLGGVGCESCHGPGSAHVDRPTDAAVWTNGVNRRVPDRRACMDCHDPDNSPDFAARYETDYLPRVDHRAVPTDRRTVDRD